MKNFGLSDLLLVDPPELDPDGAGLRLRRASARRYPPERPRGHLRPPRGELPHRRLHRRHQRDEDSHVRYPFRTPAELADSLAGVEGETVVVFGRERVGLTNDELARLDEICSIPASADYPVLNLARPRPSCCTNSAS